MKKMVLLAAIWGSLFALSGQIAGNEDVQGESLAFGVHLGARGSSISAQYFTPKLAHGLAFRLTYAGLRDRHESRVVSIYGLSGGQNASGRFYFGKTHRLAALTPSVGIARTLTKAGGFARLQASVHLGPTLGLVRPYYVVVQTPGPGAVEPATVPYDPELHTYESIQGAANGFNSGWSEVNIQPGASLRLATRLDFSSQKSGISAVELGFDTHYFFSEVSLLASVPAQSLFINGTLGFILGTQW